jgi:hypothetical protein
MKPLECVGTDDEVRQCLALTRRRYRRHLPHHPLPALFAHLGESVGDDEGEDGWGSDDDEEEERMDEEETQGREEEERRRREETLIPSWCWPALFPPQTK